MLGNITHVLIDATSHEFNPLLYPAFNESINFLRISSDRSFDNRVITLVLSAILIIIIITSIKNGTRDFWKKMLVEQNSYD